MTAPHPVRLVSDKYTEKKVLLERVAPYCHHTLIHNVDHGVQVLQMSFNAFY